MLREMTPIQGLSKAKRLSWFEPQNLVSYTYMKRLREHDDTRRVYDCDPYVEVYQFRGNLYGLFVPNCDGAGDVWQWLTIGPEKCLLVDTGFGLGDTKALVETLAPGKEIIVVNTHDHYDHAFGNCRFDRVYCHESLVPLVKEQNPHMWDYLWDRLPLPDSVYERLHIRLQLFRQSDPLLWRDQHQKMVYITVVFSDMAGISFLTTFLASG